MRRSKPLFYRQGWDRYLRLGKTVRKRRKWRAAKGGDSKTRLKENGYAIRPTVGWGSAHSIRNKIKGLNPIRIENLNDFSKVTDKKTQGIIIASIGKKKKLEMIKKANELGVKILNRYKEKKQ